MQKCAFDLKKTGAVYLFLYQAEVTLLPLPAGEEPYAEIEDSGNGAYLSVKDNDQGDTEISNTPWELYGLKLKVWQLWKRFQPKIQVKLYIPKGWKVSGNLYLNSVLDGSRVPLKEAAIYLCDATQAKLNVMDHANIMIYDRKAHLELVGHEPETMQLATLNGGTYVENYDA